MILEVAVLDIIPGREKEYEAAFARAAKIIAAMKGYRSHELKQCIEKANRYLLLVEWETLTDHTEGFRKSAEYQDWKQLLHHFYAPFPTVEHYRTIIAK